MSSKAFHYLNTVALAISICVACLVPSFRADEACFTRWGQRGFTQSLMHVYDTLDPTNYTYPPLGVYICVAANEMRDLTGYPSPSIMWRLLLKLPAIASVFFGAYVVRGISSRLFPKVNANAAGVVFAYNPVLLIVGPVWGQWDALLVLGILCTVWSMVSGKYLLTGPVVVATILVKPQMLLVLPILGIAALVTIGVRKLLLSLAVGALVFLCFTAPFFAAGTGRAMIKSFGSPASACGRVTYYAPNVWAMYERLDPNVKLHGSIASEQGSFLGVTSCTYVGLFLYAVLLIVVLRAYLRDRTWEACIVGVFLSIFGAFCLLTGMHERYAVSALVFLGLLVFPSRRYKAMYSILVLTTLLNIGYVYLLSRFESMPILPVLRLALAATAPLNLVTLAIALWWFLKKPECKLIRTTSG